MLLLKYPNSSPAGKRNNYCFGIAILNCLQATRRVILLMSLDSGFELHSPIDLAELFPSFSPETISELKAKGILVPGEIENPGQDSDEVPLIPGYIIHFENGGKADLKINISLNGEVSSIFQTISLPPHTENSAFFELQYVSDPPNSR